MQFKNQPITNAPIPTLKAIVPNKPIFVTGWCNPVNGPSGCGEFEYCLVAVNRFVGKYAKKLTFEHKRIILDSSAFTRASGFFPQFEGHLPVEEYSRIIIEADTNCNLLAAVSQDYMCESAVLQARNTSVKEQQERTIERYDLLLEHLKDSCIYLMPVLQGYEPHEYVECLDMYGDRLLPSMWVGVGTMCKRNGSPMQVLEVLQAIKTKRPDLRLHGFGLKVASLGVSEIQDLLYTADSAAATLAGGRGSKKYQGLEGYGTHDPRAGLAYEIKIYEAYLRSCTTSYQEDACYRHLEQLQMAITRIGRRKKKP